MSVITKDGDQRNEKIFGDLAKFSILSHQLKLKNYPYRFEIQIFSFLDVKFLCQHDFIVMNLSAQPKWKRKGNLKNFQSSIIRVPAEQRELFDILKL